jgi:hypothetical protein
MADSCAPTRAVQQAIRGRETEVLVAPALFWRDGEQHVSCPPQIDGVLGRELSMPAHRVEREEVVQ